MGIFSIIGLIISTMCVDTVGIRYVQRLHDIGRRVGRINYLQFLKVASQHQRIRKDELMQQHLNTLMVVTEINIGDSSYYSGIDALAAGTDFQNSLSIGHLHHILRGYN